VTIDAELLEIARMARHDFLVDVALALMGRLNAQLQLLTMAFPAKMMTALLVLSWMATIFPRIMREVSGISWAAAHRILGL